MSELQLSAQLVKDVQAVLVQHDESAADPGLTSQYLCAIVGFLLGQQAIPADQKNEIMENLGDFIKYVANDVEKQQAQQAPPPSPPAQEAFGIWRPKS